MYLNPELGAALDRITERAADVRRAFTPGAMPQHDDVATTSSSADFTLDPLCVAAPEGLYFVTRGDSGDLAYTRDGSFAIRDGRLVDGDGRTVCGLDAGGVLNDVRLDGVDAALGRTSDARVESDGTLTYSRAAIDPRNGARETQRVAVGRLALARFAPGTRLRQLDARHAAAPEGISPQLGTAGSATYPKLLPLHRERSRVDIDESLARLNEAYIAFDALHAAETAKGHLGKTVMDLVK